MATNAYWETLDTLLTELKSEKAASLKKAEDAKKAQKKKAEHEQGHTSHPSEGVDDGTQPASEGSHASENSQTVVEQSPGVAVDVSTEPKDQEDRQMNVGLENTMTGEDPAVEDDYKDRPQDTSTESPANTELGPKYSSMKFPELKLLSEKLANEILADITNNVGMPTPAKPAPKPQAKKAAETPKPSASAKPQAQTQAKAASDNEQAAQAGYELAALMGLAPDSTPETIKRAVDEQVLSACTEVIKQAFHEGALTADYLVSFYKEKQAQAKKRAAEGDGPPEAPANEDEGGEDDAEAKALLESMAGGEGAGGMAAGAPPAAPSGEGEGDRDQAINEFLMALMEAGISPEELIQALQAQGGGGGAEMPPEAALAGGGGGAAPAMPPMEVAASDNRTRAAERHAVIKIAEEALSLRKRGKFKITEAKTAQQKQLRSQIKQSVRDIMGNR